MSRTNMRDEKWGEGTRWRGEERERGRNERKMRETKRGEEH